MFDISREERTSPLGLRCERARRRLYDATEAKRPGRELVPVVRQEVPREVDTVDVARHGTNERRHVLQNRRTSGTDRL